MHEKAYNNNVRKVKNAMGKLKAIKEKIQSYDAELKMSKAEAEMAELAMPSIVARRVSQRTSAKKVWPTSKKKKRWKTQWPKTLRNFEVEMGLVTPSTSKIEDDVKQMGPGETETETS